ncbi:MAG: CRISPR-associated protein Cas4 [Saprospiraceae bacterium]
MKPTGTQINYYCICHRKLWLFSNNIQMEHNSDLVTEGKLIAETTYSQRAKKYKELDLGFIKIDHYDAKNKIVREVKKSKKMEAAHLAQLKYYLWVLEVSGVDGVSGVLEYPRLRRTEEVWLSDLDREEIEVWVLEIERVLSGDCPKVIDKVVCKKCAYCDFCYA